MIKYFTKTIGCLLLLLYNLSFANDWYQIEVIAFEYIHPNEDEVELWDNHPGEPDWKLGIPLTDEATAKARRKKEDENKAAAKIAAAPPPPPVTLPHPIEQSQEDLDEDTPAAERTPPPAPVAPPPPPPPPPAKKEFVTVEEILTGHTDPNAPAAPTVAPGNEPLSFVSLPSSQYSMGGIVNKLSKQGAYRILTHTAWRQQPFATNNGEGVHIFGGKVLDNDGPLGKRYEFEGLISLRSQRYMHLDVDAVLREIHSNKDAGKYDSPADVGLLENSHNYQVYRLLQTQRIRTNKIYYYDHPLMGVIVKVSPYGG